MTEALNTGRDGGASLLPETPVGFMAGFLLFTLSVTLLAVSTADPSAHSIPFQRSLNLSRKILQDVRDLLITYKREKIGNAAFEDYNVDLKSLPRSSNVYSYWLQMQDVERLQCNAKDLNIFWVHVDFKRVDEMGECQQCALSKSIEVVSLDLRDLISQLSSQIQALNSSLPEPPEFSIPISTPSGSNTWLSKLQGYIIFRDLETYLNKVVRDFTLLNTKYQA
ncbi:cardiotrophin-2-like [Hemitrygon akajei]|uniref:cardiotrophin-2-like n=1 Tax=Hemitrygon akajei TaxID=2704970 RepID=UPI003BF956FC